MDFPRARLTRRRDLRNSYREEYKSCFVRKYPARIGRNNPQARQHLDFSPEKWKRTCGTWSVSIVRRTLRGGSVSDLPGANQDQTRDGAELEQHLALRRIT